MTDAPRVLFMGTPDFAVPSLVALADRPAEFQVVGAVSQPDRRAGRGRALKPSPVKVAALERDIPVLTPIKMKSAETREAVAALRPDLIVVAAYGRILPPALLELPRHGCVNVHASLLPRHRGASPIAHAIMAGDTQTGIAIMQMEAGLDTGPVYAVRAIDLDDTATSGNLTATLAELGAELLVETLPQIAAGQLTPAPQDDSQATYAPLLTKEDGRLDFTAAAATLARRVRGLSPWPGAFTFRGDQRVQVVAATAAPSGSGEPGQVIVADGTGIVVACGEGALSLDEVKPAGKKSMLAPAWVAGRGVALGDQLG